MHEYSIVQSLLDLCDENAKKNNATTVQKVVVKIGALSGIEPHLLETAFNTFKEHTICHNAEFVMNLQPLKIRCKSCGKENELEKNQYNCPDCESMDAEVIDGEDMYLMQLELD